MLEGHFGSPSASEHWPLASWQTRLTEFNCEQLRQQLAEQATRNAEQATLIAELEVSSASRLEDAKTELEAARSWRMVKNTESEIAGAGSSDSGVEFKDDMDDMLIDEVVMYRIIFIASPFSNRSVSSLNVDDDSSSLQCKENGTKNQYSLDANKRYLA
jgi:hypothetical protein